LKVTAGKIVKVSTYLKTDSVLPGAKVNGISDCRPVTIDAADSCLRAVNLELLGFLEENS